MDPIQTAILFGIWDMLRNSSADTGPRPGESPDRPATAPAPKEYLQVQQRLDRMALVVRAMWTLLAEKAGVTEADLARRITDLDASDGVIDGRVTTPPFRCSCGAMVCRRFNRCLFCGKQYADSQTSPFDTV